MNNNQDKWDGTFWAELTDGTKHRVSMEGLEAFLEEYGDRLLRKQRSLPPQRTTAVQS